jgi:hypothetical protein
MNIEIVSGQVFEASPQQDIGIFANSYYAGNDAHNLLAVIQHVSRSDTVDATFLKRSADNGRTWSQGVPLPRHETTPQGILRRFYFPGYVDPGTGRLIEVRMEGILPTDDPLEGQKYWQLFYRVSEDGGRTYLVDNQLIAQGEEFNADHPFPGVWRGKNAIQRGAVSCVPLTLSDGTLLFPCQIPPLDSTGKIYNPTGGFSYTDVAVLRATWQADKTLSWEISQPVAGDPARSTRGLIEPTLAVLNDGRLLMVMRGSNHTKPELPAYKWAAYSEDGGQSWTSPTPWTYDDGAPFFSPSASSQLMLHSSGALLWIGNITDKNADNNSPRYPLVAGFVDLNTGLLKRDSLQIITDRQPDESEKVQLSNFFVREDRKTGEIIVHLTRLLAHSKQELDWTSDAMVYRLRLNE